MTDRWKSLPQLCKADVRDLKKAQKVLPHRQIKYPVDFDDELKIRDVRHDKMT